MVNMLAESVFQTSLDHWAGCAYFAGPINSGPIGGEEYRGRKISAVSLLHPLRWYFHGVNIIVSEKGSPYNGGSLIDP